MRAAQDKARMNRMLGLHGLAQLDDPGLAQQLAYLVQGHDHFRQLLTRCEPEQRRNMYEAMRPHLRFVAKPLDVYIAESGRIAEERQLPIQNPDGTLRAFHPPVIETAKTEDEEAVQEIVEGALAQEHLTVVCRKCTRTATFSGLRKADAVQKARDAGWTYDEVAGDGREICPVCPAVRN